jgi:uncharacterized protein involved in cysteine biosynthesis
MGLVWAAFSRALGQWSDPRFRRVVLLGVGLTLALLVAVTLLVLWGVSAVTPDHVTLPFGLEVWGVDTALSIGSVLLMLVLSVFLMVPVASAFSGIFLDDVVDAVEARHYPALPPGRRLSLAEGMITSVNFIGVMLIANLGALILWPFAGPFIPLLFWAVNGWLLGQEYFTLVALRRMDRRQARQMRRANRGTVWLAGMLMAAPLTVPVVNLLIPVFGAATFTHLYQMLANRRPG